MYRVAEERHVGRVERRRLVAVPARGRRAARTWDYLAVQVALARRVAAERGRRAVLARGWRAVQARSRRVARTAQARSHPATRVEGYRQLPWLQHRRRRLRRLEQCYHHWFRRGAAYPLLHLVAS